MFRFVSSFALTFFGLPPKLNLGPALTCYFGTLVIVWFLCRGYIAFKDVRNSPNSVRSTLKTYGHWLTMGFARSGDFSSCQVCRFQQTKQGKRSGKKSLYLAKSRGHSPLAFLNAAPVLAGQNNARISANFQAGRYPHNHAKKAFPAEDFSLDGKINQQIVEPSQTCRVWSMLPATGSDLSSLEDCT